MRRNLMTLALAGLIGSLVLASDAGACCHKKKCVEPCAVTCPPPPPPAPVCEPCPPPAKCGHKFKLFGHKHCKKACAPVVCETPVYAPTYAPVWSSGQGASRWGVRPS